MEWTRRKIETVLTLCLAGLLLSLCGCFMEDTHLSPDARVAFGRAMDQWYRGALEDAIDSFKEAGELTTADRWEAFARYCISQIHEERGDSAAAQAALAAAQAKLGPHYEVVATAGECFWDLDLLEDARLEFRKALKGRLPAGRRVEVIYYLGLVCTELGHFDEAERNFKRILNPDFPNAYRGYALLLEKTGQYAEAREMWSAYLKHDPNGKFESEAREHLGRGLR